MSHELPRPEPKIPVRVEKLANKVMLRVRKNNWTIQLIVTEEQLKAYKHPWLVPSVWGWFRDVAEKLEVSPLEVIQAVEDLIHTKTEALGLLP